MGATMPAYMTKSQLVNKIAEMQELARKDVKATMEARTEVGHKELKKNGMFVVPGFAKFVVVKKPATKARVGKNPFTGEEMTFKAKPARKIVRARPVKAAKEAGAWRRGWPPPWRPPGLLDLSEGSGPEGAA